MKIAICIGGTGARILESFLYLAAAGLTDSTDEYKIYVVDKDLKCGNTTRLRSTIDKYKKMKEVTSFNIPKMELTGFSLEPFLKEINPNYDPETSLYSDFFSPGDQSVVNLYLTGEEQRQNMKIGFGGNANLGAALIESVFHTSAFNGPKNILFDDIRTILEQNVDESIEITLTASIFGGTGAAIFPNLAAKLREQFPAARINGVLMLPYFAFRQSEGDNDQIQWKQFGDFTSAALKYYASFPSFVKSSDRDPHFIFNSLYLSGASELEYSCDQYTTGGGDQTHRFLVADLIGGLNVLASYRNPDPSTQHEPNIFGYSFGQNTRLDAGIFTGGEAAKLTAFTEWAMAVRSYVFPWLYRSDADRTYQLMKPFGTQYSLKGNRAKVDVGLLQTYVSKTVPFCDQFLQYMIQLHSAAHPLEILNGNVLSDLFHYVCRFTNANAGAECDKIIRTIENGNYSITADTPSPGAYMDLWISTRPENRRDVLGSYQKILDTLYRKSL